MKNQLFFLLFLGIATSFGYCSKREGDSAKNSGISKLPNDNNVNQMVADDGGGSSSNCNCGTGSSNCQADCLFSSCCICWDARKSEGSCGCYFGIAKCKTALIGRNSAYEEPHDIKLFYHRFDEYLNFLKQIPTDLNPLQEAYKKLLKYSTPVTNSKGEVVLADENYYNIFYKTYTDYINKLTVAEKAYVLDYVNSHPNKK